MEPEAVDATVDGLVRRHGIRGAANREILKHAIQQGYMLEPPRQNGPRCSAWHEWCTERRIPHVQVTVGKHEATILVDLGLLHRAFTSAGVRGLDAISNRARVRGDVIRSRERNFAILESMASANVPAAIEAMMRLLADPAATEPASERPRSPREAPKPAPSDRDGGKDGPIRIEDICFSSSGIVAEGPPCPPVEEEWQIHADGTVHVVDVTGAPRGSAAPPSAAEPVPARPSPWRRFLRFLGGLGR